MTGQSLKRGEVSLVACLLLLVIAGCSKLAPPTEPGLSGFIRVVGSNTVTPLSTVWAEDFTKINPGIELAVSGPGSGAGFAYLINQTTDICQASRKITAKEVSEAKANGIEPYETQVATDALAVVVNPANPILALTIAQLSAIYTNRVTNWADLGGKDMTIVALARDTNSGTHLFFKEHVVQMQGLPAQDKSLEYGLNVLLLPSTEEGVSEVARNPNAIFYAGLGYVNSQVKVIAVEKTPDVPGVLPSVKTALDGSYPVARPLLYYTDGTPTGIIKVFIDYCLSPAGQNSVIEVGFVPLSAN